MSDKKDEATPLKLAAQRALWGSVPASLRAASIEKEGNTIRWKCIFDKGATEDELELAMDAGAEIIADFSSAEIIDERIVRLSFPEKMEHLQYLGRIDIQNGWKGEKKLYY
jgi:hypothetical protein